PARGEWAARGRAGSPGLRRKRASRTRAVLLGREGLLSALRDRRHGRAGFLSGASRWPVHGRRDRRDDRGDGARTRALDDARRTWWARSRGRVVPTALHASGNGSARASPALALGRPG